MVFFAKNTSPEQGYGQCLFLGSGSSFLSLALLVCTSPLEFRLGDDRLGTEREAHSAPLVKDLL